MQFTPDQASQLEEILRWRRDVRHFRTDPLPEETLDRLRQAMDYAPSVGNARPWRVIRVRDHSLRAAVREEFIRCNGAAALGYDDTTRAEYLQLKLAGLNEAPEHLAVFTHTDPAEGRKLGRLTMPETLRQSTAMAIHTMWLMARAENLGLQGTTRLAVTRILGLDPDPRFAAEFATDPFAAHSAGLARLLAVMRARLTRPWVAALPEAGHYRLILIGGRLGTHCYADNVRHPTLASVEIAAFAWRWQALFGQPCPLEKTA